MKIHSKLIGFGALGLFGISGLLVSCGSGTAVDPSKDDAILGETFNFESNTLKSDSAMAIWMSSYGASYSSTAVASSEAASSGAESSVAASSGAASSGAASSVATSSVAASSVAHSSSSVATSSVTASSSSHASSSSISSAGGTSSSSSSVAVSSGGGGGGSVISITATTATTLPTAAGSYTVNVNINWTYRKSGAINFRLQGTGCDAINATCTGDATGSVTQTSGVCAIDASKTVLAADANTQSATTTATFTMALSSIKKDYSSNPPTETPTPCTALTATID